MQIKVRFRDVWRFYDRGDEADLNPEVAKALEKADLVTILEEKEQHPKKKIDKKTIKRPPRDKMLRGGNKQVHKK